MAAVCGVSLKGVEKWWAKWQAGGRKIPPVRSGCFARHVGGRSLAMIHKALRSTVNRQPWPQPYRRG
ncbi:hypothetical protein [Streptomyces sp. NPDC021356]|uniref:hypothetical protein n=1 Tax=Streptomyces sp. NPDC021356 TaxID=3154900 RepID=UPI0033D44D0B